MKNQDPILMLDSALAYAARGWAVFPIAPEGKTPVTKHGCKDATADRRVIAQWWTRWPNANIGLATGRVSGLIALDFDCKSGKSGLITQQSLHNQFQYSTLSAQTPSGGAHELFEYPGPALRNAVDRLPGLDIRTDGGYIVVAPSVVGGKHYRWTSRAAPARLPAGLLELLRELRTEQVPWRPLRWSSNRLQLFERARRYVAAVPGAIEGHAGDVATFRLACHLVRGFDLTDQEAMALLLNWNVRCRPKWTERELLQKITSARRNGKELIGSRMRG